MQAGGWRSRFGNDELDRRPVRSDGVDHKCADCLSSVRCHMKLLSLIINLCVILAASGFPSSQSMASGQAENAHRDNAESDRDNAKPVVLDRQSSRGDYDIEHYEIKKNDFMKIKMRGIYEVVGVNESYLLLKPLPNQCGLLPSVWKVPAGRSPIGNHHKIVVSNLNVKHQTATVAVEYKARWHWWDINF